MNGLTLGKYAPFHMGHYELIRAAKQEVDGQFYVVVYDCPDVTPIPTSDRAQWIRYSFPDVKVIEAYNAPLEEGYTFELMTTHENYIIELLDGVKIDRFYSSERYGEHMSAALGALDCRVDMDRTAVPVSGTQVRDNPYEYRKLVPPHVYRDLITNVVFMGGPSTGKTTLCEALADIYHTEWMPEYGREYWQKHQVDRRLSHGQLRDLANGHVALENVYLLRANQYLFTDTEAITTYLFSLDYHGDAHWRVIELADKSATRYDLFFLCDTNIPFEDTPERSGDTNRQMMQAMIVDQLKSRRIPYITLSGDLEYRIRTVRRVLRQYTKYLNLGDATFMRGW